MCAERDGLAGVNSAFTSRKHEDREDKTESQLLLDHTMIANGGDVRSPAVTKSLSSVSIASFPGAPAYEDATAMESGTKASSRASNRSRRASRKLKKAPGAPRRFKSSFIFFSSWKHKEIRNQLGKEQAKEKVRVVMEQYMYLSTGQRGGGLGRIGQNEAILSL